MSRCDHRLLHEHAFALVDRLLFPEDQCPEGLQMEPLVPLRIEGSARMLPGLVSLHALSEETKAACLDLLAEQVDACRPVLFGALLKTKALAATVAAHFRSTLLIKAPGYELYLRQFDPRLFVQYDWLLKEEQRSRLFGPITGWTLYLDGEWRTYVPPADAQTAVGWRLTSDQAARIESLQRINRALAALPAAGIDLRQERASGAYALLDRARQHGLSSERCLTRFLEHGWMVHPRFDQHPEVSGRLQRMSSEDDFPYLAAVADLDAAAFARIREDLAQGDPP